MSTLDQRARAEYEKCPTPKPDWDQLSEVTKGVWRERVNPPVIRKEVALRIGYDGTCSCGRAAVVKMLDNTPVILVAPNDSKLDDAVRRFIGSEVQGRWNVVLFDEKQIELDDEI
jgi:hypothetical protein